MDESKLATKLKSEVFEVNIFTYKTIYYDQPLEEVLTRWGLQPQPWLVQFQQLDRRCKRVLGAAHHVLERAGEAAQRWFQGLAWCREIFAGPGSDTRT